MGHYHRDLVLLSFGRSAFRDAYRPSRTMGPGSRPPEWRDLRGRKDEEPRLGNRGSLGYKGTCLGEGLGDAI